MPVWTKEQSEAISKDGTNIIVSAGAGSGKTAVLSQRVIDKLEKGIHINELLILTFTASAASEMKNRIRKRIASNDKYKNELNLLNSSYITTFDSFALSIVQKYYYLLNISKNISITDESIVKIEENKIIDKIFERYYEEKNNDFELLIKKYCVKNDYVLRNNILKIANNIDEKINKNEFLDSIESTFFNENNINDILNDYKELLNDKRKLINFELNNCSYYFDNDYYQKLVELTSSVLNCDLNELYLYTKVSLPSVPRNSSDEQKNIKNNLKKSIDDLLAYNKYGTFDDIKKDIFDSKDTIFTIINIIKSYIKEFNEYKKNNSIYTFNDIASLAIKVVSENKNVQSELIKSFKEIMIDEYQDTNDIQETFINLIGNNNVYMVGDIKQSIYRFRGSNPNIFKQKYEKYSKNDNGYKIDLIKNFRSRKEVLTNINRIFELIMDSNIGGAQYKESHEMIYGNIKYDEKLLNNYKYDIEILEYNNENNKEFSNSEIEIFSIANDIKNKIDSKIKVFDKETEELRDIKYSDFVIILDRSKYFEDYKRIFEYKGIPLTILKDDKLNTSNDILLIKNIIDIIIRIKNNDFGIDFKYDFMSIGRSFLYEYSDNYLFEIFKNNEFKNSTIYKDFYNIESINSITCSELLLEILDITDFYNKINKIGDYNNINVRLEKIYDLSNNMNTLGYTIEEFRDYLDKIIIDGIDISYNSFNSNTDSVKIMTIHKSKGLEYPICYFADIDHKFNMSDVKDNFIVDDKYGLIVPPISEENDNNLLKELYKYNYSKEEIGEKIRLFYVALTRTREKIIIVLPYKDTIKLEKNNDGIIEEVRRLKFNKLSDLIYSIKDYLPEYFTNLDISKQNLTKDYLYNKKIDSKIDPSNEKINVQEIEINNNVIEENHFSKELTELINSNIKENMKFGTKIHEILELIDLKNCNYDLIEDEYIKNKIKLFLSNELFSNILDASIYHEYEFEYIDNDVSYHGIIDLMLEYDDHIDIIDFKLKNTDDKHYIEQLNGYKKYISKKTNKSINMYLYSILNGTIVKI